MDFFEEQELAHKRTRRLVFFSLLAVSAIVLSVYFALMAGINFSGVTAKGEGEVYATQLTWWNVEIFGWTAVLTIAVIGLGALYKLAKLSAGGEAVAVGLGGTRIDPSTKDYKERRLLNIVEEMAIASGVPVPDVYVLKKEQSINAFAAGFTPSDAVIGVTNGTLQVLSRNELQGVIAHEYSHILHGDIRLNLRAIAILHGIMLIAIIGRWMIEAGVRGSSKDRGGVVAPGLALLIIGSVGLFFGRLLQAAISRQREILADASAVQFTREPNGLANALKKIGGISGKSFLHTPAAEEASHLFFGEAVARLVLFEGLMRTHPDLNERITKLDPTWNGEFPKVDKPSQWPPPDEEEMLAALGSPALAPEVGMLAALDHIGNPGEAQVSAARIVHAGLRGSWLTAARDRQGAQALVFGMLLADDEALRDKEVRTIRELTNDGTAELALVFSHEAQTHTSAQMFAAVDLSMPALRQMSPEDFRRFEAIMDQLIRSDGRVDLLEYALSRMVRRHLARNFRKEDQPKIHFRQFRELAGDACMLLSTLARVGAQSSAEAQVAFEVGCQVLEKQNAFVQLLPASECNLEGVDKALKRYEHAAPVLKKNLMYACGATVMADNQVTDREMELIRAIGDSIDCPVPPIVS